jgi:DNA-binding winged helix-turn-helix (wHTH) protein
MQAEQGLSFGPYHLEGPRGPLRRKSLLVNLPPKAVAILWELLTRAGQVVTKEELFTLVWTETVVSENTLTSFIRLLRRALKDDPQQPRYIATVHRQGYRFIAPLSSTPPVASSQYSVVSRQEEENQKAKIESHFLAPLLVGRETELTQLHSLFAKTLNGERQIIFVSGEAGIGKTALIDAFVQRLASRVQSQEEESQKAKIAPCPPVPNTQHLTPVFIAQGQGIEHYGVGEPYLPVLEALGRLGRQPEGE